MVITGATGTVGGELLARYYSSYRLHVQGRDAQKLLKLKARFPDVQIILGDLRSSRLHEAIKLYLVQVSKAEMSEEESQRYLEILTFTTNLEHIGDIIDKNLMELAAKKIKNRYAFSPEGLAEIRSFHARIMDNMRLSYNVFATRDVALARRLLAEKAAMRAAELSASDSHFARLREGRPESIETSSIHLDIIRDLKRINGHLTSVVYPILELTGELHDSRLREPAADPVIIADKPATSS